MLKTLFLSTLFGALTLLYFHLTSTVAPTKSLSNTHWDSPYAGWHARALLTHHPSPYNFTPTYDTLLFAALVNAPFDPRGVTLTLYSQFPSNATIPNDIVAVDSIGRVLLVPPEDGAGIMSLARRSLEMSSAKSQSNTWFVKLLTTCPTLDLLWTLPPNFTPRLGRRFKSVEVHGFSKLRRELEKPQNGVYELPDSLWELIGLVNEAGEGNFEERDQLILAKVRKAVDNLGR